MKNLQNQKLIEKIEESCNHILNQDPSIAAFVPGTFSKEQILDDAVILTERYPDVEKRPPLFGTLLGVKDIFNVDGFETRAGSSLPAEVLAGSEASSVKKLKELGCIIAGKLQCSQFAWADPAPTKNPLNELHTPGGSSSGSAAAVSAGLLPFSIGTQTVVSVIAPAAFCGVIGYKPSYSRIPTDGVLPCSESVDTIGMFVENTKLLKNACEALMNDWSSQYSGNGSDRKIRLGIPSDNYLELCDEAERIYFSSVLRLLEEKGFESIQIPVLKDFDAMRSLHFKLVAAEFFNNHKSLYSKYQEFYRPKSVELYTQGSKISVEEITESKEKQVLYRNYTEKVMKEESLDAIVSPSTSFPAPLIDGDRGALMSLPWSYMKMPVCSLPGKFTKEGLRHGIQIAAPFGSDEGLIDLADNLVQHI